MTQVVVELIPQHEKLLSKWASVGRTLDAVERALNEADFTDPAENERAVVAYEEIKDLHAALEALHMAYRSALWACYNSSIQLGPREAA